MHFEKNRNAQIQLATYRPFVNKTVDGKPDLLFSWIISCKCHKYRYCVSKINSLDSVSAKNDCQFALFIRIILPLGPKYSWYERGFH